MILIGQIGERVDLGEVGAEGIAELIGAVAAVGVGAVGVDGTAGVDVAVVIAGSGGVAEVKQIILGIKSIQFLMKMASPSYTSILHLKTSILKLPASFLCVLSEKEAMITLQV